MKHRTLWLLSSVVLVAVLVGGGLFLRHHRSISVKSSADVFSDHDPFKANDENMTRQEWLAKLSGTWVSVDGRQSAGFTHGVLHFDVADDWPELSGKTFQLDETMSFQAGYGSYLVSSQYSEPDVICLFRTDSGTEDISKLTLYRDGSELMKRRHHQPLSDSPTPERIERILAQIPSIHEGETKSKVFRRIVSELDESKLLIREKDLGQTDLLYDLDLKGEWMLKASYATAASEKNSSDGVLIRFQIVHWHVDKAYGWPDKGRDIYPYYCEGKVIGAATRSLKSR